MLEERLNDQRELITAVGEERLAQAVDLASEPTESANPLAAAIPRKRKRNSEDLNEHLSQLVNTLGFSVRPPAQQNKIIYRDGRVYEGQLINHLPHGFGRIRNTDGSVFEGIFERGAAEGLGRILFPDGKGWRNVTVIGDVIIRGGLAQMNLNGYRYLGTMDPRGQFVGPISIFYPEGDSIEWYNGMLNAELQPSGSGKIQFRSGEFFEGEFANGKPIRLEQSENLESLHSPISDDLFSEKNLFSLDLDSPFFEGLTDLDLQPGKRLPDLCLNFEDAP